MANLRPPQYVEKASIMCVRAATAVERNAKFFLDSAAKVIEPYLQTPSTFNSDDPEAAAKLTKAFGRALGASAHFTGLGSILCQLFEYPNAADALAKGTWTKLFTPYHLLPKVYKLLADATSVDLGPISLVIDETQIPYDEVFIYTRGPIQALTNLVWILDKLPRRNREVTALRRDVLANAALFEIFKFASTVYLNFEGFQGQKFSKITAASLEARRKDYGSQIFSLMGYHFQHIGIDDTELLKQWGATMHHGDYAPMIAALNGAQMYIERNDPAILNATNMAAQLVKLALISITGEFLGGKRPAKATAEDIQRLYDATCAFRDSVLGNIAQTRRIDSESLHFAYGMTLVAFQITFIKAASTMTGSVEKMKLFALTVGALADLILLGQKLRMNNDHFEVNNSLWELDRFAKDTRFCVMEDMDWQPKVNRAETAELVPLMLDAMEKNSITLVSHKTMFTSLHMLWCALFTHKLVTKFPMSSAVPDAVTCYEKCEESIRSTVIALTQTLKTADMSDKHAKMKERISCCCEILGLLNFVLIRLLEMSEADFVRLANSYVYRGPELHASRRREVESLLLLLLYAVETMGERPQHLHLISKFTVVGAIAEYSALLGFDKAILSGHQVVHDAIERMVREIRNTRNSDEKYILGKVQKYWPKLKEVLVLESMDEYDMEKAKALAVLPCSSLACKAVRKLEDKALKSKRCAACKCVRYCCVACQKKDWKEHKAVCKLLTAERYAENGGEVDV